MNLLIAAVYSALLLAVAWITARVVIEWIIDTDRGALFMVGYLWLFITAVIYILNFTGG